MSRRPSRRELRLELGLEPVEPKVALELVDRLLGQVVLDVVRVAVDVVDGCRRTAILINNGVYRTDALISHKFPLEKVNEAFHTLEKRPAGYMKGIVTP